MSDKQRGAVTAFVLLAGLSTPLLAHDLWIVPSPSAPCPGQRVLVELRIGHPGHSEPFQRQEKRIRRFAAIDEGRAETLAGVDGASPAGHLRPESPARTIALVYESNEAFLEMEADAFDRYLAEEGLDGPLASRRAAGAGLPGRERYSRSVKALLPIGSVALADRPVGLPLELVLRRLESGEGVFELLFHGAPLGGTLVELMSATGQGERRQARTDDSGLVRFALGPGLWLLAAVHMIPADAADADWRSFWTSLTLDPSAPDPSRCPAP